RVHANVAILQVCRPGTRERTHGGFCSAVNTIRRQPFTGDDGRVQDDRGAVRHQRKRLLHREKQAFHVDVEDRLIELLGYLAEGGIPRDAGVANTISSLPFSLLICAKRRSRSLRSDTSPWTPVTFLPISLTAAANSDSRRPVMYTYAPSLTNRFAVARPMPLLPPVISAIFPSSLPIWFSLVVIPLVVLCERLRSALQSPRAHPNDRERQSLSGRRRAACVGAPSPTTRAPHLDSSASACSHSFLPACRNSSLSLVPATARDNDSAPYIRAIKPSALSRPSTPASSISESEPAKPDNSFSSALR